MFTYMLTALVGAIANRIRGGGVISETSTFFGSQKRRIIYILMGAAVFVLSNATVQGVTPEGVTVYTSDKETLIRAFCVMVALFVPLLTGWGRPIGALGGWEDKPLEEFAPLDKATTWLLTKVNLMPVAKRRGEKLTYVPVRCLRLWGFVWLTLWGSIAGGLVAISTASIAPLVSFSLIGVTYYTVFAVYRLRGINPAKGWPMAEYAFGAVSFIGLVL